MVFSYQCRQVKVSFDYTTDSDGRKKFVTSLTKEFI